MKRIVQSLALLAALAFCAATSAQANQPLKEHSNMTPEQIAAAKAHDTTGRTAAIFDGNELFATRVANDPTGNVLAVALADQANGQGLVVGVLRTQATGDLAKLLETDPAGVGDESVLIDVGHGSPMNAYQIITGAGLQPTDMPSAGSIRQWRVNIGLDTA